MDDAHDPAEETRKMCVAITENIADRAASVGQFMLTNSGDFIACAQEIEHYITNGQDVAIVISDGRLAKTVRGDG
jgi:hypothetical protein